MPSCDRACFDSANTISQHKRWILTACLFLLLAILPGMAVTPPLVIEITSQTLHQLNYRVTNPITGGYISQSRNAGSANISTVINSGGVLAWREQNATSSRYDVRMTTWRPNGGWTPRVVSANSGGFGQTVAVLQNLDGVVCWLEGVDRGGGSYDKYVFHATCDPEQGWDVAQPGVATSHSPSSTDNLGLTTRNGVVAWRDSTSLGGTNCSFTTRYSIYNPVSRNWQSSSANSGTVSCLAVTYPSISSATVSWTRSGATQTRGYVQGSGWGTSATTTFAYFIPSTTSGNAPLTVWFVDMSINAGAVSYSFGDGTSSGARSPYHTYSGLNLYTARQTAGASTFSVVISTDVAAPSGTVVINGGAATTASTAVTLTLSATDNSGSVASMRFSNDGATWSAWEGYATSKSWTLTSGGGTKTVSAQFQDAAGNVSGTASDTITLMTDQTPPTVIDVVDVSPDPRMNAVSMVDVIFSEPISLATFTYQDVTLTRSGNPIPLSGAVTTSLVSGNTYRLSGLAAFTAGPGNYVLTVTANGIQDPAGNAGTGSNSDAWTLVLPPDAIIYVDRTYAGPIFDGTLSAPFRMVNEANDVAQNGNTLRIFSNNYPESLHVTNAIRIEATNGLVNIGRP